PVSYVGQELAVAVPLRNDGIADTPIDAELGVVEAQHDLVRRTVEIVAFVKELRHLGSHHEPVRETARYPKLPPRFRAELDLDVLAKGRAAKPHINGHIDHASAQRRD